jgi:hypothetical protein
VWSPNATTTPPPGPPLHACLLFPSIHASCVALLNSAVTTAKPTLASRRIRWFFARSRLQGAWELDFVLLTKLRYLEINSNIPGRRSNPSDKVVHHWLRTHILLLRAIDPAVVHLAAASLNCVQPRGQQTTTIGVN